jgi:uncharacterized protein (TIGR02145 family)
MKAKIIKNIQIVQTLLCPIVLSAQNGVKVSNLAVDAGMVTFAVSWNKNTCTSAATPWRDTVWVIVDYNRAGVMERLPLLPGATLTATSAPGVGQVIEEEDNNKGVWVVGNARSAGSFSATVKLLTATADLAGACVYALNHPPVGKYLSASEISFTGTPPYEIVLKDKEGDLKSCSTSTINYLVPAGYTVQSFSDKAGAPGILKCKPPVKQALYASSSCAEAGGVQFALGSTQVGAIYQLYESNVPQSGATLTGTETAATFTGLFGAGTYSVQTMPGAYCQAMMQPSAIPVYPAFTAGAITSASTITETGKDTDVTIQNEADAFGGGEIIEYRWRRTGTSSKDLGSNTSTYDIDSDTTNYSDAGVYYFNRYARNNVCDTAWTPAAGTYTLTVNVAAGKQPQGSCTYTEPAVVGTFADFDKNYSASTYVSLTDEREKKNYPVVKIGGRWIMARNLNYQKDLIWEANSNAPSTSSGGKKVALIGHFWCPGGYREGSGTSSSYSCEVWGALYSWETAMMIDGKWSSGAKKNSAWSESSLYSSSKNHGRSDDGTPSDGRGICPPHWHVPTDKEWGEILNAMEGGDKNHNKYIGWVSTNAGIRGKSKCTVPDKGTSGDTYVSDTQVNWYYNNDALGTDSYGLRALPAGRRSDDGSNFHTRGLNANFWSSSAYDVSTAWYRSFYYLFPSVFHNATTRSYGQSVRCIKD